MTKFLSYLSKRRKFDQIYHQETSTELQKFNLRTNIYFPVVTLLILYGCSKCLELM